MKPIATTKICAIFTLTLDNMPKTIEFHNTPGLVREYVNNWLIHARKGGKVAPAQLAILEDVLQLIDVAMTVLEPGPAEPAKK